MGWWMIPAGITLVSVWATLAVRDTPTRGLWGAVVGGSDAAATFLFGVATSLIAWMVYFIFI